MLGLAGLGLAGLGLARLGLVRRATIPGESPLLSCRGSRRILFRLQEATHPASADAPGFRLHPLKGDRTGQWSVRVSGNWRVVFRFEDGEAVDVDLVDYH